MVFCNDKKQIYFADILNINESDQNILKNTAQYIMYLPQFLLADRGFNNKAVKKRLNTFNCELISPNHYQTIKKTGKYFENEIYQKQYKKRWDIEVIFKIIKQNQSNYQLNLKGKYTKKLKKAKFYITIISYNLSTI